MPLLTLSADREKKSKKGVWSVSFNPYPEWRAFDRRNMDAFFSGVFLVF